MEHAIRKHCTVHHDEDPAFYKSLADKVEKLIDEHQDQWDKLAEELEKLGAVAIEGRKQGEEGMSKGGYFRLNFRFKSDRPERHKKTREALWLAGFWGSLRGSEPSNGTEGRNRTDTMSPSPDFESGASTSSATPAKKPYYNETIFVLASTF
jgi:hypothetical protein